jgi:catechol 2,3-dioxygenase-like lactoylglutathione lyase family enzyme
MIDTMATDEQISPPDIVALRPFVPATDFAKSVSFYADLGFSVTTLGGNLAGMNLGPFGFLLQEFEAPGFAGNFMMHILVNDVDAWWERIAKLDLEGKYGVRPPKAPAMQPWGLRVAYVVDPSGVLWHFAEKRKS